MTDITIRKDIASFVSEYESKLKNLDTAIEALKNANDDIYTACSIQGTYGQENLSLSVPDKRRLERHLTKSAWLHLKDYKKLDSIMTADDKVLFARSLESAPPFTPENIINSLGKYITDPRKQILRGLAEVFCSLDPFYKSHDKVKIGVAGMPKRVIISNVNSIYGYGHDKIRDILNALAQYQGKPLIDHGELNTFIENKDEDYFMKEHVIEKLHSKSITLPARGVWLKTFKNGNAHLFFDKPELKDINRALAEYYGDVIADNYEAKPNQKEPSREVAKDLQYYPTPAKVVRSLIDQAYVRKGDYVLEPSCGTGNIMLEAQKHGAFCFGIEVNYARAEEARAQGLSVQCANFLEAIPERIYDKVLMNPPFYGKHYAKHVEHALKFLKTGGRLVAVLPITAQLDHGLLDKYKPRWSSLPTGSFNSSGTNINTTLCMIDI